MDRTQGSSVLQSHLTNYMLFLVHLRKKKLPKKENALKFKMVAGVPVFQSTDLVRIAMQVFRPSDSGRQTWKRSKIMQIPCVSLNLIVRSREIWNLRNVYRAFLCTKFSWFERLFMFACWLLPFLFAFHFSPRSKTSVWCGFIIYPCTETHIHLLLTI